jgi:hypothetical protein
MSEDTIQRIHQVSAIVKEAEHLFEGRPKPSPHCKKIVKALEAAGFVKSPSRMAMGATGMTYANPQGDIFRKDVQVPQDAALVLGGSRPKPDSKRAKAAEKIVRRIASQGGYTQKKKIGNRAALSEPGGHPKMWFHVSPGGTFTVDVDYTTDY